MHYFLLSVNWILMIIMPLTLGWLIARRRRIRWRLFAIGAGTFILSQIIHIPFNQLMFSSLSARLAILPAEAYLVAVAVLAGLSAGIFEEGARYLSYRYWAKDTRSWGSGLMMGAGHVGAESIILGIVVAVNLLFVWFYGAGRFSALVSAEQRSLIDNALLSLSQIPLSGTLAGALERAFVLVIQLFLSLIVMQIFTRSQIWWLLFAVFWHAAVDSTALLAARHIIPVQAQLLLGAFAAFSLLGVYLLKVPEPVETLSKYEPQQIPDSIVFEVTPEKIEDSRYNG